MPLYLLRATEASSDLVVCNLLCLRSSLGVACPRDGKPLLQEVPPFLSALLRQLHNCLEMAWALNIVFTYVLPWSRPTMFVEGNFLVGNQTRNVVPIFPSSSSRKWRRAPHEVVVLIVHIQGPLPPCRSLTRFPLGPVFFFSSMFMVGSLGLFLVVLLRFPMECQNSTPPQILSRLRFQITLLSSRICR